MKDIVTGLINDSSKLINIQFIFLFNLFYNIFSTKIWLFYIKYIQVINILTLLTFTHFKIG